MPTDAVSHARRRGRVWTWRDSLGAIVIALAAAGLAIVGGQAVFRTLLLVPVTQFVHGHADSLQGTDPVIRTRHQTKALALFTDIPLHTLQADDLRRRASLVLMAAQDAAGQGDRDAAAEGATRAHALLQRSLDLNPVHPLTWAALAEATLMGVGTTEEAFGYLKTSYAMAAVEPDFIAYRFRLAAALSPLWDRHLLDVLRRDLRGLLALGVGRRPAQAFHREVSETPALRRLAEILVRRDADLQARWRIHARKIRS